MKKRNHDSNFIKVYSESDLEDGNASSNSSRSEDSDEESSAFTAITLLKKFSLIQVESHFLYIHRLVQEVIRINQDRNGEFLRKLLVHVGMHLETGSKFWDRDLSKTILQVLKNSKELLLEFSQVPAGILQNSFSDEVPIFWDLIRKGSGDEHVNALSLRVSCAKNRVFVDFDYISAIREHYKVLEIARNMKECPTRLLMDIMGSLVFMEDQVQNAEKHVIIATELQHFVKDRNDTESRKIRRRLEKPIHQFNRSNKSVAHIQLQSFVMDTIAQIGYQKFRQREYPSAAKYFCAVLAWYC